MSRDELATMLEQEGFPTAADRILGGGDPSRVLGELRPFVAQRNDNTSRLAVATFQAVCRGELEVH